MTLFAVAAVVDVVLVVLLLLELLFTLDYSVLFVAFNPFKVVHEYWQLYKGAAALQVFGKLAEKCI